MKYVRILWSYILGLCYIVWMKFLKKKALSSVGSKSHPHLVVTLTSYGRRAARTVPYALESMLVQTLRPDRIILWLDNANFSADNLPKSLVKMRDKYGVEIRFCEDIRSYKKLIPTLDLCPNDILVTIDDDLVYKRDLLRSLYNAHKDTPNQIICALAHQPKMCGTEFEPYRDWKHNLTKPIDGVIFPLGGSGVLYPPHSLAAEVIDDKLFMRLAPQADDVWFWAMGVMASTKVRLIDFGYPFYQIDLLYQKLHRNTSLMASNLHENFNDVQIKRTKDHFLDFVNRLETLYGSK